MQEVPPTPESTLTRAREIAMKSGVRYAYTGNVSDVAGGSTYCHQCGKKLIGRNAYNITEWHLTEKNFCEACATPCAGVFEESPGTWGARRLPVRMKDFIV
jgi:pyruvate formate lyase activating enzyme